MAKSLIIGLLLFLSTAHSESLDWNDKALQWYDYPEGMKKIKQENAKGLLIFYANWCSTCKEYSNLFKRPEVVKALKQLVLIKVDREANLALSKQYDFDGEYIPRTFAINQSGEVMNGLYDKDDQYVYFLPSHDPDYLINFVQLILEQES